MFEFQISVSKANQRVLEQIFQDLKQSTKGIDVVLTTFEDKSCCNIVLACQEIERPRVCFLISDAISDAISTFFKLEFIQQNVRIPIKDEVSFQAFIKALVSFDRETDKYIVSRALKIEDAVNLESFFMFKLKQLRQKWLEVIKLANDNAAFLLCNETFLDLLKFLIENIEISTGTINVVKKGSCFQICDENFNEISKENCLLSRLEESPNSDVNLVTSLIALSPKKINVYCSPFENNNALTLISQIFENRVSILPDIQNLSK